MLKSSPIFKRTGAHLVGKKNLNKIKTIHFQGLNVFNMQKHFLFVSSFEHINFAINGKYSKTNYDNSNYYASCLWYFKHIKMQFQRASTQLGASFEHVFTWVPMGKYCIFGTKFILDDLDQ
jgi:hypothetical protein